MSWGRLKSSMTMKSLMNGIASMFPSATWTVEPVMKSRFSPKYQSMMRLSFPLVIKAGFFLQCFFLPAALSRLARGQ
jgi:hypothetical protein